MYRCLRISALVLGVVPVLLSACASGKVGGEPDGKVLQLAAVKPAILDEGPADSITMLDIVNRSRAHVSRTGEIYLMRGLANVFSRGIDQMARELRGKGYDAVNFSYTHWRPVAEDIVRRHEAGSLSYPLVIIGHSLGANESSRFANALAKRDITVALVVAFDPVESGQVGAGIEQVVNYYLPRKAGNQIRAGEDFTGEIDNVDVTNDPTITHTNVDKNAGLQEAVLERISKMTVPIPRSARAAAQPAEG